MRVCEKCGGRGEITKVEYIREDGQINSEKIITCPDCGGSGKKQNTNS